MYAYIYIYIYTQGAVLERKRERKARKYKNKNHGKPELPANPPGRGFFLLIAGPKLISGPRA